MRSDEDNRRVAGRMREALHKSPELARLEQAMGKHAKNGLDIPDEDDNDLPFILMSIEGEEAAGKSDLAMRGPKEAWRGKAGLVYFHTDYGYDRVRPKVRKDKRIKVYGVPYITPAIDKKKQWQAYTKEGEMLHDKIWKPFMAMYHDAVKYARTVVLDTGGEFYQLLRICHFGKLHQNPQLNYGVVKAEFLSMIREAKRNHTNLIILHQRKDFYKRKLIDGEEKSINTGERTIDGMDKMNYLIDAFVLARSIPPQKKRERSKKDRTKFIETIVAPRKWEVEILNAKHDLSLNGMVLNNPSFGMIAGMMKPDVDSEVWE